MSRSRGSTAQQVPHEQPMNSLPIDSSPGSSRRSTDGR